jgi:predicted nucleic-acid-binding protein
VWFTLAQDTPSSRPAQAQAAGGQLVAALERLLAHAELTLQDADVVAAAPQRFRAQRNVGFSDCLVLETARKAGHLPLGTLDRRIGRLQGAQQLG